MTQNTITITGKIAFDVKTYNTKNGKMASVLLNVYTGKNKENKHTYMDVPVKTFDTKIATSLENLGKGTEIIVVGKLGEDKYEKDGKTIKSIYVNASFVGVES